MFPKLCALAVVIVLVIIMASMILYQGGEE